MSSRTTSPPPRPATRRPRASCPPGSCRRSDAAPAPQFRPNAKYVLMLGLMCALPAVSTDMYLPSLPDVARDLNTSATAAQLTMTAMLIGGAVGQLVIGPLSDRFGRRKPVLIGVVAARRHVAAVRDRTGHRAADRAAHRAGLLQRVGHGRGDGDHPRPVRRRRRLPADVPAHARDRRRAAVRPVARRGHRRAVGLARRCSSRSPVFGVVLWVVVWRRLPGDAAARTASRTVGCAPRVSGYRSLLRDRHFVALAILPGLGMAVLMSYVVASPFVLREGYGLSRAAVLAAVRRQRHRSGAGCPGERLPGAPGRTDPDRARGAADLARAHRRAAGPRDHRLGRADRAARGAVADPRAGQLRPAERLGAGADPARGDRRDRRRGHRVDAGRRRRASSARCRDCSAATRSRWRP